MTASLVVAVLVAVLLAPGQAAAKGKPWRSGGGLHVSATPSIYPAFDAGITDYVTRCTAGEPIRLAISASPRTKVAVDDRRARKRVSASIPLSEGQGFSFSTSGRSGTTYHVRCLPADFPQWTFERFAPPSADWYMVAPIPSPYAAVFDRNGVPVWWTRAGVSPVDFRLLPNGNVAWHRFDQSAAEEHRLDGSLVRVLVPADGADDFHEIMLLPNGNYLLTVRKTRLGSNACGQSSPTTIDNGFQEIEPDGSLVRAWWASEHIPPSDVPAPWCEAALERGDWYHINSVQPVADGYLVSLRNLDAVYKVSDADGSILWKLGGVDRPESLQVLNDPQSTTGTLWGQHDARLLSDGTVTVLDNGFHPTDRRPTRAVRYSIDTSARTATLVEQKRDPNFVASGCCGSARRLPGGAWLMSWGGAPLVTELSPSGSRVFSLTFETGFFSYRAHPVPPGVLSRAALRAGMDAQFPRP